jgi:2-hydroxychromene-2-carboxylate isomerase
LYWSFRSPYSYLITDRVVGLAEAYDVEVHVRLIFPLAIRSTDWLQGLNPLWEPYMRKDTQRVAEMLGIRYRCWPRPDPVVMNFETKEVSREQPYIHRLVYLAIEAERRNRGLSFIQRVGKLLWSGEVDGWDRGDHLARAVAQAGLNLAELDQSIEDGRTYAREAEENLARLKRVGHWGVPTLVYNDEPFFGQDRFDMCVSRLRQCGVRKRDHGDLRQARR